MPVKLKGRLWCPVCEEFVKEADAIKVKDKLVCPVCDERPFKEGSVTLLDGTELER